MRLEQQLGPECANRTLFYPIQVPPRCRQLQIDFEYEPKRLTDEGEIERLVGACLQKYFPPPYDVELGQRLLQDVPVVNLLTVSLDDVDGVYVGCAHRHTPQQHHEISAQAASSGFRRTQIRPGRWRLGLQCHAVVTDPVSVRIVVKGVIGDEMDPC